MCSNRRILKKVPGGFSMLEMMVVLVIIGLLAGMVTMNVRSRLESAKRNTAKADLSVLAEAVETYYLTRGRYPRAEEGLDALTRPGSGDDEPLLDTVPLDPWGNPYEYLSPGVGRPYEIRSLGADSREGGEGVDADLGNWDVRREAAS
jgi:general secretion pathway protein G